MEHNPASFGCDAGPCYERVKGYVCVVSESVHVQTQRISISRCCFVHKCLRVLDRETERCTERKADRQTGRQTDRKSKRGKCDRHRRGEGGAKVRAYVFLYI